MMKPFMARVDIELGAEVVSPPAIWQIANSPKPNMTRRAWLGIATLIGAVDRCLLGDIARNTCQTDRS